MIKNEFSRQDTGAGTLLNGIVSVLEGKYYNCIRELWIELEERFGLNKVCVFPHPHITFQMGIPKKEPEKIVLFNETFKNEKPFLIKVNKVQKFGTRVIYLKVEKTKRLTRLNKKINNFMNQISAQVLDLYEPCNWIPHITLAMDDIPEDKFNSVFSFLKSQKIRFNLKAQNLVLVKSQNMKNFKIIKKIILPTVPGLK